MGYSFMTIEKIKDKGTLSKKYDHNYRKGEVKNADPELAYLNEELVKLDPEHNYKDHTRTYIDAFNDKLEKLSDTNKTIRKNAVLALEVVTTFSRDELENVNLDKWKQDQVKWLEDTFNANKEKYGNNVISVMYHGDENGNVHCHAMVVPIDDKGKLNASYYLDGRAKMIQLQDSYGKVMHDRHGLKRGLKNSVAKHQDIKKYYAQLNQAIEKEGPEVGKVNGRMETAEEYKKRSDEVIKNLNLQILAEQKKAERAIAEQQTLNMNEKLNFYREKKKVEEKSKKIEEIEDIDLVIAKAKTMDVLNEGFKTFPDKKKAKDVFKGMQEIIEYQKELEKKENIEKKDTNI